MKRTASDDVETVGHDSFVDVLSNVVGILIILVMVVGARVRDTPAGETPAAEQQAAANSEAHAKAEQELTDARRRATSLATDVGRLTRQQQALDVHIHAADQRRERLGTLVRIAERKLESHRQAASDPERKTLDLANDLIAAHARLDELHKQQITALAQTAPEIKIESYPTPISVTVLGREEHFRLLAGRIVRVPFEELKDLLMGEKRQLLWKLKDLPEVSGTVGPVDDFRLHYHLVRTQTGGSLTSAECLPTTTALGQPLAEALLPDSSFRRLLAKLDPASTTVTVWTYPDSFGEFRLLKKELYKLGYAVAARPQSKDGQIGFSPQGSRSASQ